MISRGREDEGEGLWRNGGREGFQQKTFTDRLFN